MSVLRSNRALTKLPFTFAGTWATPRGLAPALVSYAVARETLSLILRFEAAAGEVYRVMAEHRFNSDRQDITTLSHVNFWVKDSNGATVVSHARGSYQLPTR